MLRSLKVLRGYHVQAYNGPVGTVEDFYFDDEAWTVRYLVVDTGHFLSGRKALIASASLGEPE